MNDFSAKIENFSVINRNIGHWDIITDRKRIFRLRGGPGKYSVIDERDLDVKKEIMYFKTVGLCMSYICEELMFELIIADGQKPHVIESWNV